MTRTFKAVLFSLLVAGAMLTLSPAGSAQGDITVACAHGCPGFP